MKHLIATACAALAAAALSPQIAAAEDFYAGKTVTVVTSTGEGGGYDFIARALSRHMPRYIPGQPSMIVQNMPGGGHMLATNFMYNVAPKDGTRIATVNQNIPAHQVLDGRGVRYDAAKFNWLGAFGNRNAVIIVWHTAGIETIEDAMRKEIITGATGEGSSAYRYPLAMNKVLGTKFKIIKGYKSTSEVFLAMERGEVQARGGGLLAILFQQPDWVKDHKLRFLVQIGGKRDELLADVPLWTEVAKTEEQRRVLQILGSPIAVGRPYLAPPGVPEDRVAILRRAFDGARRDKALLDELAGQNLETLSIDHEELTGIILATVTAPPAVVEQAKAALLD